MTNKLDFGSKMLYNHCRSACRNVITCAHIPRAYAYSYIKIDQFNVRMTIIHLCTGLPVRGFSLSTS